VLNQGLSPKFHFLPFDFLLECQRVEAYSNTKLAISISGRLRSWAIVAMAEVKIEKFRDLDDFVLNSARFQVPQMNGWGRRLKANLIYYQTNYFALFAVLFLLMG